MRFFIDTANVEEIRRAAKMGFICGVTTNPSLIAKEGRDFSEVIREIAQIVDGPISGEVISLDAAAMIDEGRADRRAPSQYGCQDPHDGGRAGSGQRFVKRGNSDQRDLDFFRSAGALGGPCRRNIRIAIFRGGWMISVQTVYN